MRLLKKILSKHSSHNPFCGTKRSEAAMHHLHLCVLYRHFPGAKQMALALSKAEPGKLTWVFTCLTINWSLLPHSLILKTGPNFSEIIKTCFQSARNSVKNHHMKNSPRSANIGFILASNSLLKSSGVCNDESVAECKSPVTTAKNASTSSWVCPTGRWWWPASSK